MKPGYKRTTALFAFMLSRTGDVPISDIYETICGKQYREDEHRKCQQELGAIIHRCNKFLKTTNTNRQIKPGKTKRTYALVEFEISTLD